MKIMNAKDASEVVAGTNDAVIKVEIIEVKQEPEPPEDESEEHLMEVKQEDVDDELGVKEDPDSPEIKYYNSQDYLDIGDTVISEPSGAPASISTGVIIPESDEDVDMLSLAPGISTETVEPRSTLAAFRETHPPPSHASTALSPSVPQYVQISDVRVLAEDSGDSDEDAAQTLPGNEAEDFYALIPDEISERMARRIQEVDAADDTAICALLSPDDVLFDWQADASVFKGEREVFTGVPGPTCPLEELELPVDSFLKFWDAEIIDLIVTESNSYAEREILKAGILKDHSRLKKWQPITREELLVFFAVLLVQGNYPLPVERKYFYNTFRYAEMPLFRTMMSYDRFLLIKKFLHFTSAEVPSSATREQAKLHKIQPILDHLARKFESLYMPEQEIALDESLLKWLGRLSFAQKIATKAAGEGIKSYELCESRTGYLWSFKIYAGKTGEQDHNDEALGLTAKVVYDLAKRLFGKGHTLVMDNFYNSPLLSRCLKRNATDVFGTLRINREFIPQPLKDAAKASMRIGEVRWSQCEDMTMLLWRDSNLVAMISTYHPVVIGVQEKHEVTKYKPKVVLDYNSVMGGVDKKDQLLAGFPIERAKNTVWYKKLFRRMLNVSTLNAMIMYRWARSHTTGGKEISHRDFWEDVVLGLLSRFRVANPSNSSITTVTGNPLTRGKKRDVTRPVLTGNHFVVKNADKKRKRCVFCYEKNKELKTMYRCDVCLVPLCVDCFKPYHTGE